MPGLSDLLKNPRRLQQFASTPGNYPAALDYASQGRVVRRAAPRASQSQAEEAGVLETGEVIDKVKLPDGSYVRPPTESGQLVKAPGKSNLYLDPATGEPYQADPSQPGGLRSAWATARRTAREGKQYATIPGVGEREIGPDPKAQADAAKAVAKREAENKRLAFAREKRPYNIDRVTGEPIALQSDEEWQKQKADKQAKLDEAAHIKKLKAQADRLDLDAEEIKLNAPKIAKEDEDAYSAAEAALAEFANGESLDTAAERLAAQPDNGDEAAVQAKSAATAYLGMRDKVKPAQEAEAKVKELNLRALDLKKQMLDPEAWKAEKAATLPALDDASLAAEAKAQAEIITEQEADANDTITKIQEGRQKIADELDAFLTLRQQKEATGITAEEMQALNDQQAQMEAALADYDDWNAEAAGEAQASLKAAGDRREVLAAAVQENERRDSAWARPLEGKWGEQQNAIMAAAEAAGLPKPSARSGESPSRALMAEAFGRLDKLGIKQPRFIGQADEPAGDRTAGKDLESLLAGLDKAEQQATTPEQKAAIANEKAYWQAEAKDAMTAEEWKAQTGEPDLQYPQERAETMGKARDLYAWAKDNFHYTDDYRGMEDYGILDAEAKKRGIDPAQAREALQYFRQLDWSNEHRDPGTGKPLDETARVLPDGNITVNPALWADVEGYKKAVQDAPTTEAAKAKALADMPKIQELYGERLVPVLSTVANIPGQDSFMKWRERKIEASQAKKGEDGFTRLSPGMQAIQYMDEMKNRSWFRKAGEQIATGLLAGAQDIATQVLGSAAMATGSETLANLSGENAANTASMIQAQSLEGSDTDLALRVMGQGSRIVAPVGAAMAGAGAIAGALGLGTAGAVTTNAVLGGFQTAGSMFADLYRDAKDSGMGHGEAWKHAALPAAMAGTISAMISAGFGATGLERVFTDPAARQAALQTFKGYATQFAKGALEELPEEIPDEFFSNIIEAAARSDDPAATLVEFANNLPELAIVSGLMGGAGGAIQNFQGRNAPTEGSQPYTPEGPAPAPEEGPAPAMPTQPRAAGQKDVSKIIEAFTPSGVPMPQAVNDTIKRTGRAPDQVAKAAASGLVKVAQGATLEGLDAREREALGFINKDGKIVPAPKTTPLVEIYKDKLVIRNEAAEWLDEEEQSFLARQIKLDEAARKAQIDEAEAAAKAKPAKKKAGQAAPKAAESKSRDSEEVITSGSLPEVTGANPVPAIISAETEPPKPSQTITGSNAETAAEMPVPGAATEPSPGEAPTPPPAAGGGLTPAQAAQEPALTPAQADQMARAKAAYESAMRLANADPSPEIREKQKKAAGMKYAAAKRQITGKLTGKEAEAKAKREASNYEGKAVSVKGRNAVVTGTAFGKVKVKFEDGTTATVPAAEVQPPAKPAAVDEAAQEAATSPAAEAKAGPSPEPAPASQAQASPPPASQETASQPEAKSGLPPKTLPVYGVNSKDVAKQYGLPDDFYIVQAAGNPSNPAAETIAVNPKYRTAELDAAEADLAKWQGVQGVNASTGRRMARERVEKAFSEVVNNAKAPASQPEAKGSVISISDAVGIRASSTPEQLVNDAEKLGMRLVSETPVQLTSGVSVKNRTFEFQTAEGVRRVTFRDDGPRTKGDTKQTPWRFAAILQETRQASQPEAQPAPPLARAQAALAAYQAKAVEARKRAQAAGDEAAETLAVKKYGLERILRKRLEAMSGVIDIDLIDPQNVDDVLLIEPKGPTGGILRVNIEGLLDRMAKLPPAKGKQALDTYIFHEFIHRAAIAKMSSSKIERLYNALTPEAKEASRKLYFLGGKKPDQQFNTAFQAAHEWFAQVVEARLRGKVSNQEELEASSDPTLLQQLAALFRDFVAQLRDIAGLVKDKAMAEQIRAEADAVQAAAEAMAAKAGLEIQPKTETPPTVSEQFKAVEPMATAMMEQSKGANADATKQSFEEWASEFGVTDLAENPTLTEKLRATYNQKRAKAGLQVKAEEAGQAVSQPGQAVSSQTAAQAQIEQKTKQTRDEVAEAARNAAMNDPSLPPSAPKALETLQELRARANRSGYKPEKLTPARLADLIREGLVTKTKEAKLTDKGYAQLNDWERQQRNYDAAYGSLADKLVDEAVSKWDRENDPNSWEGMNAAAQAQPEPSPAQAVPTAAEAEAPALPPTQAAAVAKEEAMPEPAKQQDTEVEYRDLGTSNGEANTTVFFKSPGFQGSTNMRTKSRYSKQIMLTRYEYDPKSKYGARKTVNIHGFGEYTPVKDAKAVLEKAWRAGRLEFNDSGELVKIKPGVSDASEIKDLPAPAGGWRGRVTGLTAELISDGRMMFPRGKVRSLAIVNKPSVLTKEGETGSRDEAAANLWKQITSEDSKNLRELQPIGVALTDDGMRRAYFRTPQGNIVSLDAGILGVFLKTVGKVDKWDVTFTGGRNGPVIAYRAGSPVGVVMPLSGLQSDADTAKMVESALSQPQAQAARPAPPVTAKAKPAETPSPEATTYETQQKPVESQSRSNAESTSSPNVAGAGSEPQLKPATLQSNGNNSETSAFGTAAQDDEDTQPQLLDLTPAQELILAQLPKAEAAEALKKGLGYDRPQTTTHRLPNDPLVYLDRQGEKKLGYIDQDGRPHMLTVEESTSKRQEIERFESDQKKRLEKRMETLRENARILDEQRIYQITPSGPAYYKKDGKWYERGSDRQLGRKKGDDLALQTLESANVGLYEVKVVSEGDTMYYQNIRQPAEAPASQEPAQAAGTAKKGRKRQASQPADEGQAGPGLAMPPIQEWDAPLYEKIPAGPVSLELYHGTWRGGYDAFKPQTHFSRSRKYAERYMNPSASSMGMSGSKTATNQRVYKAKADFKRIFDTRKAKDRAIFQNEYFNKYGTGTPIQERGLPDWTDGIDMAEWLEENHPEYDGIVLDEGAEPVGGKIRVRPESYIPLTNAKITILESWPASSLAMPPAGQAVTPGQDAEYMAAVQAGDMEKAQRMVDEKAQGHLPLVKDSTNYDFKTGESVVAHGFHGSKSQQPIKVFDRTLLGTNTSAESAKKGFFFAGSKDTASSKDYYLRREFEASKEGEEWVSDYNKTIKSLTREAVEATSIKEVNELPFGQYDIVSEWGDVDIGNLLYGSVSDDVDYIIKSRLDFLINELAPALQEMGVNASDAIQSLASSLPESYLDTSEGQMIEAYLTLNNPLVFDDQGNEYREQTYADRIDQALQKGHDSVVIKNTFDGGPKDTIIVVFNPSQIKSADPVTYDEAGNVIPLSQRFNPASPSILYMPPGDQSADLEAAARSAMGEAEAGQPATEAEDLAETARLMDEQQRQAEAEAKAREELRNDPANIAAVEASGAMAGRNLSKQFTDPAARSFYQALTAARDMLGGPETVVFEELRKWASRQLEADPAGAIAYATELADNKTIPGMEGQAVLAAVIEALNREVAMTGDKGQRLLLTRLGNYYLDLGTALAQGLGFRRDTVETPQDRWNKALRVVFGPAEKVRRRLRLAPTEAGKARRIAELEAQLARYQGSRRADIEAALAEAKRQETQESILEKEDAKNEKLKDQILGRMDLTERDLTLSPVDRYSLQTAILDLPQVRKALDNYPDGHDIMRQAMRGFSDEHIAGSLGLNQDEVAKFIKDATNAIIRPAVKAEVKAGRGFGDMVKSGLQALARKVGLRMAAVSGPLGTMSPPLNASDLAKIEAKANEIVDFALQSPTRRNKAGRLISKVIDTPGGKKVRVFVPFDPDDAAGFYAFAREFSTAKSKFWDKLYEYWINWPLLGGPQTQVANITGNAAQLAWHYTGQRLAEAALNVAYRDPNSAQLSEFKHIATAFFRSMGPALDMARQSFLTEGDTVRHKYLNEPMEIEFKDGALDKLGAYRPAIGGKAGRIARLPGRLLRFADAFFKTAILHTEAAALSYRKAHAKAKAQGLTGANRSTFIDTEMANDMNNQGSDVWAKAMDTAEELLFQDDSAAAIWTQALLGGNLGIKGIEKLQAEAEMRGDAAKAAKLASAVGLLKIWGKLMRWVFPFQRTPTNIIKTGLRKAGGAAIVAAWHATRAGMIRYQDGKPFVESYTKAMQIKDLSESLLAGLGWLALSSMFEGDDDDEKKPILIVGGRSFSPGNAGEREAFLRQTGGANAFLFRDKDGKTIGTLNYGRFEPVGTILSAMVDGYRNFREVNRRRSQGEPDASYLTYIGSSLLSSVEGKSFLQGFSGLMETIRDFEERREPSTANWAWKQLINGAIPNIIKQPLRNWDDLVRESKTAGLGYTALPNPEVAPKTPFFQAQPKVTTTGEQIKKGYTGPARLLFQANAVVTPQPDALLLRANRLNPTAAWFPQPLQKDDFYVRSPGSKPGTPGYKTPITDPAKQRQFAELSGKLYAEAARHIEAKASPAEKAKPTPGLIEAYKKARTEANAKARLMGGIRGLHKTATPAITTSNK